ncbi:porin [Caballeronia sp. LP006]|uniref:porin n=1 Tax=Caballeronia sp. LP006 TaxID=3038552 RepID=UPI0028542A1B|nr:porin [Caballeronia sp. LP006]MDR5832346.1 porin [Caballeronia sp. LP006]
MKVLMRLIKLSVLALGISEISSVSYAQSSVTLYGVVGTYIDSAKRSGGPQAAVQLGSGGLTTSYFGLRGREDLGGGYAAIFGLESFFQPANGSAGRNTNDPFFFAKRVGRL